MLCIVHCATMPLFAMALPLIENSSAEPLIHLAFLAVAGPVGLTAIIRAVRFRHLKAIILLSTGLLMVLSSQLLPMEHFVETILSVIGGVSLILGHRANCRCESEQCEIENETARPGTGTIVHNSATLAWKRPALQADARSESKTLTLFVSRESPSQSPTTLTGYPKTLVVGA
jgi:hypothetical protein